MLNSKITELVTRGELGLASGKKPDGGYERVIFSEYVDPADVVFESGVFLLTKSKAKALKTAPEPGPGPTPESQPEPSPEPVPEPEPAPEPDMPTRTFKISGDLPPEIWNRLGTKIIPKLRSCKDVKIGIEFSVTVEGHLAQSFEADIRQALEDLGLAGRVGVR